jgi:hypothetical protein
LVKRKSFPATSHENPEGIKGMLVFHPYFWHSAQLGQQSCQPLFTLKGIPWYSFLLEAEWTPGLLNADRSNRSLDNFQGPYRESKPKTPVLWNTAQISRKANYHNECFEIFSSCIVYNDKYDVIRHRPQRL